MSGRPAPSGPPARLLLEPEPDQPRYFITMPGMGYHFESEQEAGAQ